MTDPSSTWRAGRAGHGRERRTKATVVPLEEIRIEAAWRGMRAEDDAAARRRAALDDIAAIGIAEGLYEGDEF